MTIIFLPPKKARHVNSESSAKDIIETVKYKRSTIAPNSAQDNTVGVPLPAEILANERLAHVRDAIRYAQQVAAGRVNLAEEVGATAYQHTFLSHYAAPENVLPGLHGALIDPLWEEIQTLRNDTRRHFLQLQIDLLTGRVCWRNGAGIDHDHILTLEELTHLQIHQLPVLAYGDEVGRGHRWHLRI